MKLYDFGLTTSAQRVRVFLAEKGIEVPLVELNVRDGSQYKEPYATMNPFHCVPFLELDDGTVIAESVSICRYLEELHPEPSLFGSDPVQRATIDMWNRRVELDGFMPILHAVRNHIPMFAGKVIPGTRSDLPQSPAMVERGQQMLDVFLSRLEPELANRKFIAGPQVSVADITAWFMMNMAGRFDMETGSRYSNITRWHQAFSERPSTQL